MSDQEILQSRLGENQADFARRNGLVPGTVLGSVDGYATIRIDWLGNAAVEATPVLRDGQPPSGFSARQGSWNLSGRGWRVVSRPEGDHWDEESEPVHLLFGLSYSTHLVWNRSLLQSMPVEWQRKFCRLAEEVTAEFPEETTVGYDVIAVDDDGNEITEPIPHYNRGRTRIKRASEKGGKS